MKHFPSRHTLLLLASAAAMTTATWAADDAESEPAAKLLRGLAAGLRLATTDDDTESEPEPPAVLQPGVVNCANLIYGDGKTSKCFSPEFLSQIRSDTNITANAALVPVQLDSAELFQFPFAVMTGEGAFKLTETQRVNMRNYLENGGFITASAGCSSQEWQESFRTALSEVFPELQLTRLDQTHPVFHTVYEIETLDLKGMGQAHLEGLEIDGKIVLIFSPDGLNDTSKAGGNCCCCGGSEIKNARQVNVNLLAYTLTH
jgi:hypothetical protein